MKILTGSKEFWPESGKDTDYICVDENQTEVFRHVRENGECCFSYKPMTKDEYLTWLEVENSWYLNTAPLITVGWLERMGIDIFGEDKDRVYKIMEKLFNFRYRNTKLENWNKYAYRLYIYTQYITNGKLELTRGQLDIAYQFKIRKITDSAVIKNLYLFFGVDEALVL